ncbi:MAG TPA: TlpA disulfide reductase family protein [Candidatus Angelobacter sp.]|nr:TlpA disulfide reductase family protein [Candidatus Angelobacter sp.]
MNQRIMLALGVAVIVSALFIAKLPAHSQNTAKPNTNSQNQTDSKPQESPAPSLPPMAETPKTGSMAPDFTLTDMKGKRVQLSSFKGKAVVVDFWATWCEPCKIEMPWLVDLQKKYGPQGLQVLGVAMDDADDQAIQEFARKMGVNYPVLRGTEAVADLYGGLDGLPATFFLDRSGKISDKAMGLESQSVIEDSIKHALGQKQEDPAAGEK